MKKEIRKYDFKQGLSHEFEIMDLGKLYAGFKNILTQPHRTGFYHIIWFQKGSPFYSVDFNLVKNKPGTLLFVNKDTVQSLNSKGNFEGKVIIFTDSFFCRTEADSKFLKNTVLFNDLLSISQIQLQKTAPFFANLIGLMQTELLNKEDKYQPDILRNHLHSLLLLCEREKRKQGFTEIKKSIELDHVIRFKDMLEEYFHKSKQVCSYAKHLRITEKKLNQSTTKITGKSPKQLIDERVLLEAKRLLAYTSQSVKEIGFELGFTETTNFIKYFRKQCGTTPVEFRNNISHLPGR